MGNMLKSAGDLLTAHASRVARESDVRYVQEIGRREVAARTFVAAEVNQTFIVPLGRNITVAVKTWGRVYEIVIKDPQPLSAVAVWNSYGVTWYVAGTWAASTHAAGHFSVDLGRGVTDILPDGRVDINHNAVTVCQSDAPCKAHYSQNNKFGAVQTVAAHAALWCPGSTALVSYPWIGADGVTGQWIHPSGLPARKSWSPSYCACSSAQDITQPPSLL
jgi:hypothetical protein